MTCKKESEVASMMMMKSDNQGVETWSTYTCRVKLQTMIVIGSISF
jgi:hypothetical protein